MIDTDVLQKKVYNTLQCRESGKSIVFIISNFQCIVVPYRITIMEVILYYCLHRRSTNGKKLRDPQILDLIAINEVK